MSDPPKRTESSETTAVRPRSSLPPVSSVPGPTMEHLADVAQAERERRTQDLTETLVLCEGPCKSCSCCHGERLITSTRRDEWRRQVALVAAVQVVDDCDETIDGES